MAWQDTDISFKKLNSKRVTTSSPTKTLNEERGAFSLNISASEIWAETVPDTPPVSTTSVVEVYDYANRLTLVEDTSVASKMTWFATTESDTTTANNGSNVSESARLLDWIPDKYDAPGTVPGNGYEIKVYDKDDVLVPKGDASNWFFDYQTGILMFKNAAMDTGTVSSRAPYKIVGYRYIGLKGSGALASIDAGTGLTASPSSPITTSGTMSLDLAYSPVWTGLHSFEKPVTFASPGGADGPAFIVDTVTSTPSTLSGGEFWYDGTALNFRHSGSTYNLLNTLAIGGTVGSGTPGSVLFVDGSGNLGQDTTAGQQFYYDAANHRVGLGTTTPTQKLEIQSATASLRLNTGVNNYDARLYVGTSVSDTFGIEVGGSSLIKSTSVMAGTVEVSHPSTLTTTIRGSALEAPSSTFTASSTTSVSVTAVGTSGQSAPIFSVQDASSTTLFSVTAAGQAAFPITGTTGGLLVGGDASLYRAAAQTLQVGSSLIVGANLTFGADAGSYGLRAANISTINLPTAAGGNSGAVVWDTTDTALKLSTGTSWVYLTTSSVSSSGVSGTGTSTYVPLWNSSSSLGDSIMSQDSGSITVAGNFKAYAKSFKIPHPLDPEHKILEHGSLEGPEHGAYQRGRASGHGKVRVDLPDYWPALVREEYTIHLTPRGPYTLFVAQQDQKGFVVQRSGRSIFGKRFIEFDWLAIGHRADVDIRVEQEV